MAVWVAAAIVPGIQYDDWQSLLIAALVLGVLNTLVKPLLQLLALPFIILTMGLFLVVTNAVVLLLTSWLVSGFHVSGFWSAAGGSLVISILSLFLGQPPGRSGGLMVERVETLNVGLRRGPPPGKGKIIDV